MAVELIPVRGLPLIGPGADLARTIVRGCADDGSPLQADDVVVVTGKVVSKAEGRIVDLGKVEPSPRAKRLAALTEKDARLVEVVLRESVDVVRARPGILLVRHRLGFVSAVAGVDRSNVDGDDDHALLLPEDPNASAARLRADVRKSLGIDVGVVITDSHGRPFRIGNTGVAIGSAGIKAVNHLEGQPDLFGRPLTGASVVPVADLLASAAMLVSGEADEAIPVVIVRGLPPTKEDVPASALVRPADADLFAIPDRDYT